MAYALSTTHIMTLPRSKEGLPWRQADPNPTTPSLAGALARDLQALALGAPKPASETPPKEGQLRAFSASGREDWFLLAQGARHKAQPNPLLFHSAAPALRPVGRTPLWCWGHRRDLDTACPPPMTWHKDLGQASVKARYVVRSSEERDLTHLGEVQGLPEGRDPREGVPGLGDGPANP